jgi:hypothetical protein
MTASYVKVANLRHRMSTNENIKKILDNFDYILYTLRL